MKHIESMKQKINHIGRKGDEACREYEAGKEAFKEFETGIEFGRMEQDTQRALREDETGMKQTGRMKQE